MNDLQITYFLEIVKQDLNYSRAAEHLFISQPALTKQIARLEAELQLTLLDTSNKRHIVLTPAGMLFYDYFSDIYEKYKCVLDKAKNMLNQPYGHIKLVCITGISMPKISKAINAFCLRHPYVNVSVTPLSFKEMRYGIENEIYDIAITTSHEFINNANISTLAVASIPLIFIYSADGKLGKKKDLSPKDFDNELLYVLHEDETNVAKYFNNMICSKYEINPMRKVMPNLESIYLAISNGNGFAIVNSWARVKENPNFRYLELDVSEDVIFAWKKSNKRAGILDFIEEIAAINDGLEFRDI